jgi:AbrB family looped-hinge helix DNA binding protein
MKKYPKPIQCDERGQLVIPKDIRSDLGIEEGTGFLLYTITSEGILLKKIEPSPLDIHHEVLNEIEQKAEKLGLKKDNLKKSIKAYEKVTEGKLELI